MKRSLITILSMLATACLTVGTGCWNGAEESGSTDGTSTQTSSSTGSDSSSGSEENGRYTDMEQLTVIKGAGVIEEGAYKATSGQFLAVAQGESGDCAVELTVNQGGVQADDGMVFSMTYPVGESNIWEGIGISYYFYFVSQGGTAYLGKTENARWSVLATQGIPNYSSSKDYTLKAEKRGGFIACSLDNEVLFTCPDSAPLSGSYYGVRAGGANALFKNLSYQKLLEQESAELVGFDKLSGSFVSLGESAMAEQANSLAISKNEALQTGTVSATTFVPAQNGGDIGLAFGYNDGEYYYFSVTSSRSVKLEKITSSGSELIKETSLVAKYSHGAKVNLSVTFDGDKIYTYIDEVCLILADGNGAGKWGLKSSNANGAFTNYQTRETSTPIKADVLLWGHSHMQLWDNYKTDLAGYGKVVNMGIGGSTTPYWSELLEEVLSYEADTIIVMTGSNDVPNSNNDFIMDFEDSIYKKIVERNPNVHIILITEFLQPCRLQYANQTRELNQRYFAYEEKHDFMTVVDAYDIPLNADGTLNENFFRDIYHLTTAGYDVLKMRVRAAIEGTYTFDKMRNYTFASGAFVYDGVEKAFASSQDGSIALRNDWFVDKGKVSADVQVAQNGEAGIVFNYDESGYYGAILKENGLELYKVVDGQRSDLQTLARSYNHSSVYTLEASFDSGEIKLSVDGLESLTYIDTTPLTGTGFGFIASNQSFACKLDAIKGSDEYKFNVGDESSWQITEDNGVKTYTSLKANSLLMFQDITFTGGRIEFDMTVNAPFEEHCYTVADGVVFGASTLAVNNSYGDFYVFGRCPWGTVTGFAKDDGAFNWEDQSKGGKNVAVGETYHYEFVWDSENGKVEIYENGVLVATTVLTKKFDGEYVGIYVDTANTVITNLTFTQNA